MSAEHHFRIDDAKKWGVEKAIILYNLSYWIEKNRVNDKHLYKHSDGKNYYWTYNSSRAFNEMFPYIPQSSISRYLIELERDGVIVSGNFNKTPYDKTKWYAIKEDSITQNEKSSDQNEQPIPDINTYTYNHSAETPAPRVLPSRRKRSFGYDESAPDDSEPVVDAETGQFAEITPPAPRVPKDKQAKEATAYFQRACNRATGTKPLLNDKGYYLALKLIREANFGPKQFRSLIDDWFSQGLPQEKAVQITHCFSTYNVNQWQARNPVPEQ